MSGVDTIDDAREMVAGLEPLECERLLQAVLERCRPKALAVRLKSSGYALVPVSAEVFRS